MLRRSNFSSVESSVILLQITFPNSEDEDDTNFLFFMNLSTVIDPLTTTLNAQEEIVQDFEDEQDELLNFYNELIFEHIKSKKAKQISLEILNEKKCKINALKIILEEKTSSIDDDKNDLTKKF